MTPLDVTNELWSIANDEKVPNGSRLTAIRDLVKALEARSTPAQGYSEICGLLKRIAEGKTGATPTQRLRALKMIRNRVQTAKG
jgi:hypothetical protein